MMVRHELQLQSLTTLQAPSVGHYQLLSPSVPHYQLRQKQRRLREQCYSPAERQQRQCAPLRNGFAPLAPFFFFFFFLEPTASSRSKLEGENKVILPRRDEKHGGGTSAWRYCSQQARVRCASGDRAWRASCLWQAFKARKEQVEVEDPIDKFQRVAGGRRKGGVAEFQREITLSFCDVMRGLRGFVLGAGVQA